VGITRKKIAKRTNKNGPKEGFLPIKNHLFERRKQRDQVQGGGGQEKILSFG